MTAAPPSPFIGPHAHVAASAQLGTACVLDGDVVVQAQVRLGAGVLVQGPCTLAQGAQLHAGVRAIGPHGAPHQPHAARLHVGAGACVEAGALLTGGIDIGAGAIVRAGAVVTQSVPPHAIVAGAPARITGYTNSRQPSQATASLLASAVLSDDPHSPAVQALAVQSPVRCAGQAPQPVQLHRLKRVQDMRGDLSVGEFADDIPFEAQRYFLVYNVPSEHTRGAHAHKACHQFLICVSGSCSVVVDDGENRAEVLLDAPHLGLYMPPMVWGIQYNYSPGAVLLVYASHRYDADDYIREYPAFLAEILARKA